MPLTKSSKKSNAPSHSASSQGGSRSIESTEHASSLEETLGSLSIRGWPSEHMQDEDEMTPDEQASEYTRIWNSRCTDLTTEVAWRLSKIGQAWKQADPVEQVDIVSHSAAEQATNIFNELYPHYTLTMPAPYQSRYHQSPLLRSPPPMPTSQAKPFSLLRSHPYKGKGQVPDAPPNDRSEEEKEPKPSGSKDKGMGGFKYNFDRPLKGSPPLD
ncbi:uncharacterized protein ARMOST_11777 [Armillaria ostoyae]|uniref:Uncharacterized protein n=1 Tax=Armillaria ostoyae TaxID=47428 RepID=A0A284RI30_ARMOS|nr:uncharacterized protein ARMOST_11777 [Armillaria ostoyae]